jgi:hypothetical protein
VFEKPHWLGLNAGIFLMRNCKWSFDLMDALMEIGEKGIVRNSSAFILNDYVAGREQASDGKLKLSIPNSAGISVQTVKRMSCPAVGRLPHCLPSSSVVQDNKKVQPSKTRRKPALSIVWVRTLGVPMSSPLLSRHAVGQHITAFSCITSDVVKSAIIPATIFLVVGDTQRNEEKRQLKVDNKTTLLSSTNHLSALFGFAFENDANCINDLSRLFLLLRLAG